VKRIQKFYDLDVIISVGYRVKSKRGTAFRIWARFGTDPLFSNEQNHSFPQHLAGGPSLSAIFYSKPHVIHKLFVYLQSKRFNTPTDGDDATTRQHIFLTI